MLIQFDLLLPTKGHSSAAAVSPAGGGAETQRAAHHQAEGQAGGAI